MQQRPSVGRRFLRTYRGRIVVALVLIAIILTYHGLAILISHQREMEAVRKIEAAGGQVFLDNFGPRMLDPEVLEMIPFYEHATHVGLDRSEISTELFQAIQRLPYLMTLTLRSTKFVDSELEYLARLNRLEGLHLGETQIGDAGLEHLENLTGLKWLVLFKTKVTNIGLKHLSKLTSLQKLSLTGTQVNDIGLEHLYGLTNLKELRLEETQTTVEGQAKLRKALPNCVVISAP